MASFTAVSRIGAPTTSSAGAAISDTPHSLSSSGFGTRPMQSRGPPSGGASSLLEHRNRGARSGEPGGEPCHGDGVVDDEVPEALNGIHQSGEYGWHHSHMD
jgi:hypothetical protein